jgi:glycosyltransferase involved in cell wall biosynthesis
MNPASKLSVVTTSYNQAAYIEQTMQSVFKQSLNCIEYIVVDGGSTDTSHEIIYRYKDNIDVLIIESDRGPADALNKGFQAATGDYLAFLNSDDTYDVSFAEVMLSAIDSSDADLVYSDVRFINAQSLLIEPYRFPLAYAVSVSPKKLFARACVIPQQGSIWSRRIHDAGIRFNIDNHTCWDLEFFVDALCAGFSFHPVHQCLSSFRLHDGSISGESLFSGSDHVNSRLQSREADHARIRKKLIEHGYECNNIDVLLLKFDNLLRRASRMLC